ncbi:14223_t:CDS:2, partial [Racocetra persica]
SLTYSLGRFILAAVYAEGTTFQENDENVPVDILYDECLSDTLNLLEYKSLLRFDEVRQLEMNLPDANEVFGEDLKDLVERENITNNFINKVLRNKAHTSNQNNTSNRQTSRRLYFRIDKLIPFTKARVVVDINSKMTGQQNNQTKNMDNDSK